MSVDPTDLWIADGLADPQGADLLNVVRSVPNIRERLHTICALYAHEKPHRRPRLLDHLESLALEAAAELAQSLLAAGWRPVADEPEP